MSRQVPLCASRTGGIPEAVIDGETGFLFSPGSPEALVQSVLRARMQSRPGPPAGGAGGRQGPVGFFRGSDGGGNLQDLLRYTKPIDSLGPAMSLMEWVFISLGLKIGSFLNVCIVRIPRRQSIVSPRSSCTHCGRALKPYDNIPLISYLVLGGKCRFCKGTISWQYPVVEALTAAILLGHPCQLWAPVEDGSTIGLFFGVDRAGFHRPEPSPSAGRHHSARDRTRNRPEPDRRDRGRGWNRSRPTGRTTGFRRPLGLAGEFIYWEPWSAADFSGWLESSTSS